jgi:16S rRNA (cytidine1402-2'-O)-methyltransferase
MAKLTIVPTPIGNMEDITLRALRTLKETDLILAEDTRTTGILLKHFDIKKPLMSHHIHNEHKTVQMIAERINGGENVALVSDAGTPGISDPGYLLIRACIKAGIDVECLPGPAALIPALVCSGIPCDHFLFAGFLPHKKGRMQKLIALADADSTVVLYESPFRLQKTLLQIKEYFGEDRQVVVARELTKIHEEISRGTAQFLIDHYENRTVKGEIVIVIAGKSKSSNGIPLLND